MQNVGAVSKMTEWSLFVSKANHSISQIQGYAPTTNIEEAEVEWFYDNLQALLELTPKKRCPLNHTGLDAKIGSQEISGVTGNFVFGVHNEAGERLRVFPREHTGHRKHFLPTRKEDDSTHVHHQMVNIEIRLIYSLQSKMEKLYTVSKNKNGSWLWLRPWTSYWKIQTKLMEVWKITRPLRYDVSQTS